MGISLLQTVIIFVSCFNIAKYVSNRNHPKWGLYGVLLSMPISLIVSFIMEGFGFKIAEYGDYSLKAYLSDCTLSFSQALTTIVIFTIWMMVLKLKPAKNKQQRSLGRIFKIIQILWIIDGISIFFIFMARDMNDVSDALHIQLDNSIAMSSWTMGMGYLIYLRKRNRMKSIETILEADKRPPVLFLRSFETENIRIRRTTNSFIKPLSNSIRYYVGYTFDELIEPEITKKIGPFITLGNSKDYLPMLGAARSYVHDNNWQLAIKSYCQQASVILFLESIQNGAKWELEYIRQNIEPQKLFIVTFSKKFKTQRANWYNFKELLLNAGYYIPFNNPGYGVVISFNNNWEAQIIRQNCKLPKDYANTISLMLHSFQ